MNTRPPIASEHLEAVMSGAAPEDTRMVVGRAAAKEVMNQRNHVVKSVTSSVIAAVIVSGLGGAMLMWRTSAAFDARISNIESQLSDLNHKREADALLIANVARDVSYMRGLLERNHP